MLYLLRLLPFLLILFRIGLWVLFLLFLFPYLAILNPDLQKDYFFISITQLEKSLFQALNHKLNSFFPVLYQHELISALKGLLCIVLLIGVKRIHRRLSAWINRVIHRAKFLRWRANSSK